MGNGLGSTLKGLIGKLGHQHAGPALDTPSEQAAASPLAQAVHGMTGRWPIVLAYYELAFLHSSTQLTGPKGERINNERLEFLGDAVFDLAVADLLFRQFPLEDEGFLTETRAKLVNTHSLERIAKSLGIVAVLQLDARNTSLQQTKGIYADAVEALIGAVYLDLGYAAALEFVVDRLIAPHVDWDALVYTELNYKSKVFEWGQRAQKRISFETLDEQTHAGNRQHFRVALLVDGEPLAEGSDYSKKQAEQAAAAAFYKVLQQGG